MAREHWLDAFSKTASQASTRRGFARTAALLPELLLGGSLEIAAAKNTGGKKPSKTKKKKGKGNGGKGPQRPGPKAPPPVADDCAEFAPVSGSPEVRNAWLSGCREQREVCPDDFCLYIHDWDRPDDSAAVMCCPSPKTCCPDGCFDMDSDPDHCGDCRKSCENDEVCVEGDCVGICWSRNCPRGQGCITSIGSICDGQIGIDCQCGCGPGLKHCPNWYGGACVSANSTVC